jgi:hypothetical protein
MSPTNKLVSDMVAMQACYVNTTHPDFISGHKAMALITERMNANKPQEKPVDAKSGKLAAGALNNGKDLDADLKKDDQSFFGSFFAKDKQPKRKGGAMEAPPPVIKPVASLNERELMETEVISELPQRIALGRAWRLTNLPFRTPHHVVLFRRPQGYYPDPRQLLKGELAARAPRASLQARRPGRASEGVARCGREVGDDPAPGPSGSGADGLSLRRKECIKMVGALNAAEAIVAAV